MTILQSIDELNRQSIDVLILDECVDIEELIDSTGDGEVIPLRIVGTLIWAFALYNFSWYIFEYKFEYI